MALTAECPNCQRQYKVEESLIGHKVKCKHCGSAFTIEAPPPPDIDPFSEAVFDAAPEEKPVAKKTKLYNPVDSGTITSTTASKGSAPAAPPIAFRPARRGAHSFIGTGKLAWLILLLLVVVSVSLAIYFTVNAYSQVNDTKIATAAVFRIWGWIVLFDILFFALLGPMMLLGVWASTKVLNAHLESSAYVRACAVAAIAVIFAAFGEISPELLKITFFVLLPPAVYYALKIIFDLDWAGSGVATAFGVGGLLVGGFLVRLILGLLMTGSVFTAVETARELALARKPAAQAETESSDSSPSVVDSTPPLAASQDPVAYARFKDLVSSKTSVDVSQSTREERMPDVLELKRQQSSLRAAFQNEPDWADISHSIEKFASAVAALPSAKFDNAIYADSPNADDWTTGQLSRGRLGPEVSYRQFKIQPPLEMKLDLRSSEESPEGLIWSSSVNPGAKLSIYSRPRTNTRQRKPVVSDKPAVLRAAQSTGLLAIDDTNATPAEGQINGLTVTRLTAKSGEPITYYYIPAEDRWIIIQVNTPVNPKYAKVIQASARTIREIDPGEPRTSPFAPAFVAGRLMDDYEHAAAILRSEGSAGEAAVDALLKNPDRNIRQQALNYLKENATAGSAPALRQAMLDTDAGIAEMARAVLTRVQAAPATLPAEGATTRQSAAEGVIARLLVDLNAADAQVRKQAVAKLALIPPEERDRPAISARLSAMLRGKDDGVPAADIGNAMGVWGDATAAVDLAPLLKEGGDPDLRHAAMHALGSLHEVRSAAAIAKWLKTDSGPTVSALIQLGSSAEFAVIPYLKDDDGLARIDAARILERIGTRKSIPELTRAAHDSRDVGAQQAAQLALESVEARAESEPASATSPTTRP